MNTIAVIGGGPAGYVAAITAAQEGSKVILVERDSLGGTCLNEGCMPTKALLESASKLEQVKNAFYFGIEVEDGAVKVDWPAVHHYKDNITKKLVQGIGYLMKKNRIEVINGEASFIDQQHLDVRTAEGVKRISADKFIIATGSVPIQLPFAPYDHQWIVNSKAALKFSEIPSSLLIVGGGVIGCEFASIYSRLGTKVTLIEMSDQLLPGEDLDIVSFLQNSLKELDVSIYCSSQLTKVVRLNKQAEIQTKEGVVVFQPDKILVAVGRKPNIAGLNLEKIGIDLNDKQGIRVNEQMETNVPGIFACGDVIGGYQLAHVGFHEGKVAALNACGHSESVQYQAVPRCIYTSPEVAGVGLNERQAREKYGDIRVGSFSFNANGKALISGEPIGKVKVIVEPQYQEIVGISIVGPHATELIGQGSLMMHGEMTADSLDGWISAHPTLSEAIHEALLGVSGRQVHA